MEPKNEVKDFVEFAQAVQSGTLVEFLVARDALPEGEKTAVSAVNAQQVIAIVKAICAVMTPACAMINSNTLTSEQVQEFLDSQSKEAEDTVDSEAPE